MQCIDPLLGFGRCGQHLSKSIHFGGVRTQGIVFEPCPFENRIDRHIITGNGCNVRIEGHTVEERTHDIFLNVVALGWIIVTPKHITEFEFLWIVAQELQMQHTCVASVRLIKFQQIVQGRISFAIECIGSARIIFIIRTHRIACKGTAQHSTGIHIQHKFPIDKFARLFIHFTFQNSTGYGQSWTLNNPSNVPRRLCPIVRCDGQFRTRQGGGSRLTSNFGSAVEAVHLLVVRSSASTSAASGSTAPTEQHSANPAHDRTS